MNTRPTTIRLQEYTRNELGKIAESKGKKVGAYIREVLEVHIDEYDEDVVHEGNTESIQWYKNQIERLQILLDQEQKNTFLANKTLAEIMDQNKLLESKQTVWWKRIIGIA